MEGGVELDLGVFERLDEEEYSVFRDKSVLSLSYVPGVLVCRGREEEYLARVLTRGVSENFLPPMIRVFGGTGSGKTVVVRSVLERFSRYRKDVFRFFYVNLKECRTVFSAGNAVLSAICGRRVPVNLGLDRVFTEIWSEVRALKEEEKLFICLVLDEVDAIFMDKHFDPSDFFYRFLRQDTFLGDSDIKICLVAVTNNVGVLEDNLDGRVTSSMGCESLLFPPYSKEELIEILRHRLDDAFKPGVVEDKVVENCALLVAVKSGDARKAIDLLRVSGEIANERKGKVTVDCVRAAWNRVEKDWVEEMLKTLPDFSALILGITAFLTLEKEKISTRELYNEYRSMNFSGIKTKLSERRVLDFVNDLETVGLISTWNVSRGRRGYGKEIKMNVDSQSVLDFYEHGSKGFQFTIKKKPTTLFGLSNH
jgi:cell division control protein 6